MKRALFPALMLWTTLISALYATTHPITINVGYVLEGAPQYQIADLKIAYANLVKRYAMSDNIHVNIRYYDIASEAVTDFIGGKLDSLSGTSLLWARYYPPLLEEGALFYIAQKCDNLYERYLLLGRIDRKKEKTSLLALPGGDYNAKLFLEKETLAREHTQPEKRYILFPVKKASVAIYKLFFGKADYAVVPECTWKTSLEMNPKISRRIEILHRSPAIFLYGAGVYSRRLPPENLKRIIRANETLRQSIYGRQILSILQIKAYRAVSKESFQPFINYIETMKGLKISPKGKKRP